MRKKVEVEGKEFYGTNLRNPETCAHCAFKTWIDSYTECIGPHREACNGYQTLLTPEKLVELKLKGEVL